MGTWVFYNPHMIRTIIFFANTNVIAIYSPLRGGLNYLKLDFSQIEGGASSLSSKSWYLVKKMYLCAQLYVVFSGLVSWKDCITIKVWKTTYNSFKIYYNLER